MISIDSSRCIFFIYNIDFHNRLSRGLGGSLKGLTTHITHARAPQRVVARFKAKWAEVMNEPPRGGIWLYAPPRGAVNVCATSWWCSIKCLWNISSDDIDKVLNVSNKHRELKESLHPVQRKNTEWSIHFFSSLLQRLRRTTRWRIHFKHHEVARPTTRWLIRRRGRLAEVLMTTVRYTGAENYFLWIQGVQSDLEYTFKVSRCLQFYSWCPKMAKMPKRHIFLSRLWKNYVPRQLNVSGHN